MWKKRVVLFLCGSNCRNAAKTRKIGSVSNKPSPRSSTCSAAWRESTANTPHDGARGENTQNWQKNR